jgi:hypothetical protein
MAVRKLRSDITIRRGNLTATELRELSQLFALLGEIIGVAGKAAK